jgi:hypothetical protein
MAKLADCLYHQRRSADMLAGWLDPDGWVNARSGRRWKQPNISSLSRGRGKLGADPVRMLFEQVAGPPGEDRAPGVFCCGLPMADHLKQGHWPHGPDKLEEIAILLSSHRRLLGGRCWYGDA